MRNLLRRAINKLYPEIPKALEAANELPALRKELAGATATIELLNEEQREGMYRTNTGEWRRASADVNDLFEAAQLGSGGPGMEMPVAESAVALKERMWELELALEDRGWQRQNAISAMEFSRYGIQQLMLISRLYTLKNGWIKRAVSLFSSYVFARGVEISSEDQTENDFIRDYLKRNERELDEVGLTEKQETLSVDGNLYFCHFTDSVTGDSLIRTIDATEIIDKITDPDDASVDWYFHRQWTPRSFGPAQGPTQSQLQQRWYPAQDYEPTEKQTKIGDVVVEWDTPVLHVKVGGLPKWLYGLPEFYAAIDPARAYRKLLENWCTIMDQFARFGWNLETQGGQQAIQAHQQVFGTTMADGAGSSVEHNPTPGTGSAYVSGPGNKLTPIRTAGATTNPEQSRRVGLWICAATGWSEPMLMCDVTTGSLATAQSLDRPTELAILKRQALWRSVIIRLLSYAFKRSSKAPKGKLREALKKSNKSLEDIQIKVLFPAVLEHDIAIMISAIVQAATMGGFQPAGTMDIRTIAKLLMGELGYDDPDKLLDEMYPPGEYKVKVEDPTAGDPVDPNEPGVSPKTGGKPQPGAHIVAPSFGRESDTQIAFSRLATAVDRVLEDPAE